MKKRSALINLWGPTIFIFLTEVVYVKSLRIRSYSDPHFPTFGLDMERNSVSLRIQSECRKIRTRITPNTDTFYAVVVFRKGESSQNFVLKTSFIINLLSVKAINLS